MIATDETAILVFSKLPNAQEAKTRLRNSEQLSHDDVNELHHAFVEDTLVAAHSIKGVALWCAWQAFGTHASRHIPESAAHCESFFQSGATFAERLQNAIDTVLSRRYKSLVVIGSDCPFISNETLTAACQISRKRSCVMGPSPKGGFYLLAIPQEAAHVRITSCFEAPFESLRVAQAFNQFPLSVLPLLHDIDTIEDLYTLYALYKLSIHTSAGDSGNQFIGMHTRKALERIETSLLGAPNSKHTST